MAGKPGQRATGPTEPPERHAPGWLDDLDGRYAVAKELRARFEEVCADLGGRDRLSYMERSLVERALWLEYWLARQERALAEGEAFDVARWIQAANSLQGIYARLGLRRRAREAPNLGEYLASKGGG